MGGRYLITEVQLGMLKGYNMGIQEEKPAFFESINEVLTKIEDTQFIGSASKELLFQIAHLLLRFDIVGKVTTKEDLWHNQLLM